MEPYSLPLYLQATFQLLSEKPIISSASLDTLYHFEQARGLLLPAAVKAWYALEQAPALLSRYPSAGVVRSAQQLGNLESYWSDGVSHTIDLLTQGLLMIMTEAQSNCFWAIELNGEDDPPVLVSEVLNPSAKWHLCAEKFSVFLISTMTL